MKQNEIKDRQDWLATELMKMSPTETILPEYSSLYPELKNPRATFLNDKKAILKKWQKEFSSTDPSAEAALLAKVTQYMIKKAIDGNQVQLVSQFLVNYAKFRGILQEQTGGDHYTFISGLPEKDNPNKAELLERSIKLLKEGKNKK